MSAVEVTDGIDVGHEVVLSRQGFGVFDLQITTRLADANPIVLSESIEQLDPRLQHPVPAVALGIMEAAFPGG